MQDLYSMKLRALTEIDGTQIMDTPLPAQIRPIQQEAGRATEDDVMELVEMILGALGRDALGLGSSIAHPRESQEWQSMSAHEKLEFFAPIWRIMRDENMTVEQVHCNFTVARQLTAT